MQWLGMKDPDWRKMMLTLVGAVVLIVAGISFLLIARYRPPRGDDAAILYRKFTHKVGVEPRCGETPQSYALRMNKEQRGRELEADRVTASYLAARYGPPHNDALRHLQTAVSEFPRRP